PCLVSVPVPANGPPAVYTLSLHDALPIWLLSDSDQARVTCPRGSDLTLDLSGREGIPDDGDLSGERAFGNLPCGEGFIAPLGGEDRKSTRLNSSHLGISYAVFCLKKKKDD